MKNKTKKILAGLGLGIIGMGFLTGCSLNEDQQKALDLITEKSDEIITLLEENMQLTNSKLSKEEAYEKIMLAINKLTVGMLDQVHISKFYQEYTGVFDELKDTSRNGQFDVYFRNNGNEKVCATAKESAIDDLMISDFEDKTHYSWEKDQDQLQEREYKQDDFLISRYDVSGEMGLDEITPDDIYDIIVNEDTYEFKVFYKSGVETGLSEIIVSKSGYLLQINSITLELNNGHDDVRYNSYVVNVKYEYENIDFSIMDSKLSELQA